MMVELFHTVITDATMLGPRWLNKFTSFTIVLFQVHRIIINVFINDLLCMFLVFYNSGVVCAGAVKAVVASDHEDRAGDTIPFCKVWSWTVPNHYDIDIDYKTSNSDGEIQNLDDGSYLSV